ncbi:DUF6600 domain-containing protein [Telluribacter sp.]|jgi:hypothetical protein|uniref:DUF6600 domain-containing protein n=1 Tax=Telluribacter sp. TaxID=1978767 RepID=UPI002E15AD6C|nr:DUF6600 domain-containing protein [Telluribacter sp.]
MKIPYIVRMLCLSAVLTLGAAVGDKAMAQPGVSVSFQTFYNDLAPYGNWMSHPQYGSVWAPTVAGDFQPYATNGRWVVTEYGNTWVSDYDWGWAPFHYGRWHYEDFMGWVWVPDYEWGPAWVSWRSGGGYYGWAPLGPGIHVNVQVNLPYNYWVFVPQVYITSPRLYNYCLPRTRVVHVYNQTTIINNYYRNDNRVYAYGPRRNEIERVTRNTVPVYRAEEFSRNNRSRFENDRDNNRTYSADGNSNRARSQSRQNDLNSDRAASRSNRESAVGVENNRATRDYSTAAPSRARRSYGESSRSDSNYDQADRPTRSRSGADWSDATRNTPTPGTDYPERSSRSRQSGMEAERSTPYSSSRPGTYEAERAPSSRSYGTTGPSRARSSYGESSRSSAPATRQQSQPSSRSGSEMSAPRSRSNQGSYQAQPQRQQPTSGGSSSRPSAPRSSRSRGVE